MLAAKRKQSVYPCDGPLYIGKLNSEQQYELDFLVSRYAPTHFVSCDRLKRESVNAAEIILGKIGSLDFGSIIDADLQSLVTDILSSLQESDPNSHDNLTFHTSLALIKHFYDGRLELTHCSFCGSLDIRVTGEDNRLQKCGVCKQRKRKAQKLAVRLSQLGMRNDSINVLCENLVGNHILRTISKDFVGGGGITGRRPTDSHWYTLSAARALQSSVLSKVFVDLSLVELPLSIESGHLFAVAYETYLQRFNKNLISIDRAFSLLMMIKMGAVEIHSCTECGAAVIRPKNDEANACYFCDIEKQVDISLRKSNRVQYEPSITLSLEVTNEK